MFIGRQEELDLMEAKYGSRRSELVVVYGRRRIGKSRLIEAFCTKKRAFQFEALEGAGIGDQIAHFKRSICEQLGEAAIEGIEFSSWHGAFNYLTAWIRRSQERTVIVFDEFQWMASERNLLVSTIKYFWDREWKKDGNIILVLCGSIASFMVEKVLKSKALYGRITLELPIRGLAPYDCALFFRKRRNLDEMLKYLLIFGGVPKYFEEIDLKRSFNQNINSLCFSGEGIMLKEPERIFYSHFRSAGTYTKIAHLLQGGPLTLDEISKRIRFSSGGGLKSYLEHLEQAEFISSLLPIGRPVRSKIKKYRLTDEFLVFYFKFIEPNLRAVMETSDARLFERLVEPVWKPWLGLAFERFCLKNAWLLARAMGFHDYVLSAAPYFERKDKGFQIDLVFLRSDKVMTICEIKFHEKEIGTEVIPQVRHKLSLLPNPHNYAIETALISLRGEDASLKNSEFFNYSITAAELLHQQAR